MSTRKERAIAAIAEVANVVGSSEKAEIDNGTHEFKDATLVIATLVAVGDQVDLVTPTVNRLSKRGINSFQDGKIAQVNGGGSVVVDLVRITHAAYVANDVPEGKNYLCTGFPVYFENAEIEIKQGASLLAVIPIAEACYKGDAPQTRQDMYIPISTPFTIVDGKTISIRLIRPEGQTATATHFIKLEMKGFQSMPRRLN